jgi:hypothetical protein
MNGPSRSSQRQRLSWRSSAPVPRPATVDSDFIRVKYHEGQANDDDHSNEGLGASFKKWQADHVAKHMDSPEVECRQIGASRAWYWGQERSGTCQGSVVLRSEHPAVLHGVGVDA